MGQTRESVRRASEVEGWDLHDRTVSYLAIETPPSSLLYMLADDMARGAGYDGFAAVGIASLGAVAGALVSGVVAYFVFGRKRQA